MSAQVSPTSFTPDEARQFTDDLKLDYVILQGKIAQAFKGKIWIALGYMDWSEYITAEFGGLRIQPPRERELEALAELSDEAEMSTRQIADTYGIPQSTVSDKLRLARRWANADPESASVQETDRFRSPGSIQEPSRLNDVEDAVVVDEGESPAAPEGFNGHRSGGDVHGAAAGFEDLGLQNTNGKLEIKQETPEKVLRAFNGTGSSDVKQIRGTASELKIFLFAAGVEAGAWDQVDLAEVVDDTGDTVSELVDLLLAMAAPNETGGVSQQALRESDIQAILDDLMDKLETFNVRLDSLHQNA